MPVFGGGTAAAALWCAFGILALTCVFLGLAWSFAPRAADRARTYSAPSAVWVFVGCGLCAAAAVHALPVQWHSALTVRESDPRAGGRALSTPQVAAGVSTAAAPREFAAWGYQPLRHSRTSALLASLHVATLDVQLLALTSRLWTPETGLQPLPPLPAHTLLTEEQTFESVVGRDAHAAAVWFAHTGFWVADCPDAAADVVAQSALPVFAFVPAGFGWQDVVLRALGAVPVLYGWTLQGVQQVDRAGALLQYASGNTERVAGAVITLPVPAMKAVTGLPPALYTTLEQRFVSVAVGVLYATWATADVWWPAAGFAAGVVATTLPIGRVFATSQNDLRCVMSGRTHVNLWSQLLLGTDPAAIRTEVAAQLTQVFRVDVPRPAVVAFRAWPAGSTLWRASRPGQPRRSDVQRALRRPFGAAVPVFWASADTSAAPSWVEGAVHEGELAAAQISVYA